MKKIMLLFVVVFFAQLYSATYTVDGYAYLEGETDHSGIEVFFQRVAPDANYSYTIYTDSLGYYSKSVESGWYEAYFSRFQFANDTLTEINAYSNCTLENVTLLKSDLTGSISGRISKGEYEVSGTLTVEDGDTLRIDPGVTLKFHTGTELLINGSLFANGNETDSIKFTSMPDSDWEGINLQSADNKIDLSYCVINNSISRGVSSNHSSLSISNSHIYNNSSVFSSFGAGIYIYYYYSNGSISINNCVIENNEYNHGTYYAAIGGGGIYAFGCLVNIENSIIKNNSSTKMGGGLFIDQAQLNLKNCEINNNTSASHGGGITVWSSTANIDECNIEYNHSSGYGGGILLRSGIPNLKNCIIANNSALSGGGFAAADGMTGSVSNSLITDNTSTEYGGGAYIIDITSDCDFINLTISKNSSPDGGGIYYDTSTVQDISNCIISGNTGYGVSCQSSDNLPNLTYCDLLGNTPSELKNCGSYIGAIVTTNANGDPCDAYGNISIDPLFIDYENGDFSLQSDSPCIDAGTNSITGYTFPIADLTGNYRIWDGDVNGSEIVDMGAYEYGAPSGIEENTAEVQDFTLYQNYPNPFNPATEISYALPKAGHVELSVYNLQGQLVQSLMNGNQEKGIHKAEFNGRDLTSGLYIYNLKIDGTVVQSRKMMMLK